MEAAAAQLQLCRLRGVAAEVEERATKALPPVPHLGRRTR